MLEDTLARLRIGLEGIDCWGCPVLYDRLEEIERITEIVILGLVHLQMDMWTLG